MQILFYSSENQRKKGSQFPCTDFLNLKQILGDKYFFEAGFVQKKIIILQTNSISY